MSRNFTLEMESEQVNLELHSSKNGRSLYLFAEVCYSEECPNFEFSRDLTEKEAARITPENAAILFGKIAGYAAADIAAEARYEKRIAELLEAGVDLGEIPTYPTQIDHKMTALVNAFCYGDAYGEASED